MRSSARLRALVDRGELTLPDGVPATVTVERPRQEGHGDYATNVALAAGEEGWHRSARSGRSGRRAAGRCRGDREGRGGGAGLPEHHGRRRNPRAGRGGHRGGGGGVRAVRSPRAESGSTSSSSRRTRPGPCTWGTRGGPRWATRSRGCWRRRGRRSRKEFYINDRGSQMDLFGDSILARALGERRRRTGTRATTSPTSPSRSSRRTPGSSSFRRPSAGARFREEGYRIQLANQQAELAEFHTTFDVWFSERALHADDDQRERRRDAGEAAGRGASVRRRRGAVDADHRLR